MEQQVTFAPGLSAPRPEPAGPEVGARAISATRILAALSATAAALAGWELARQAREAPGSDLAYGLGLVGGALMLTLLFYPLRKHLPFLQRAGALKHWFRLHMVCGVAGPLLIVVHSSLQAGSLNAGVALGCMLLVAGSGLFGRFIYRRIHLGLYGRRASQHDLECSVQNELAALAPTFREVPAIKAELDRFAARASDHPRPWLPRAAHFVALGWYRAAAGHRIRTALAVARDAAPGRLSRREAARLNALLGRTLQAMQGTAQFAAYERMFALWHVLHVPFVFMLVASAVVHIIAVHAY